MNVVIDTNILVSGIFWPGPPSRVLDLWITDGFDLLISAAILKEYARILDKLLGQGNNAMLGDKWISLLATHSVIVEAPSMVTVCRDPDDNKFLDCAISGQAVYLISGDKDLLDLSVIHGIHIVSASSFLKHVNR